MNCSSLEDYQLYILAFFFLKEMTYHHYHHHHHLVNLNSKDCYIYLFNILHLLLKEKERAHFDLRQGDQKKKRPKI